MDAQALTPGIGALLGAAGVPHETFTATRLRTGGNNRVFVVETAAGLFVVKAYFRDPDDPRDRLRAEYEFLRHAWQCGIRCVPRPLACDSELGLTLYEHVAGRPLGPDEVDAERVREAARLFAQLNAPPCRESGAHLGAASEACATVGELLRSVDERIARLAAIPARTAVDREAAALTLALAASWARTRRRIETETADLEAAIPEAWRVLSPSDFGFHNALLRPSGTLCFLDFEYAGWDDPAKAIGDFFAHPAVPVSRRHWSVFVEEALLPLPDRARLEGRARQLEPAFRTKWCCIVLNEFLPAAARRRVFANPEADLEAAKRRQLVKARSMLEALPPPLEGSHGLR